MDWLESQIETRRRLDAELLDRSYAELAASISARDDTSSLLLGDLERADGAIRACLRSCGVEPGEAPEDIVDIERRIDWLCRTSGTMFRKVRLQGLWYREAIGSMLGQLDTGEYVALLPALPDGYYYHDPASGERVRLDARAASRLSEDAYYFYRPLPQGELGVPELLRFIVNVFDGSDYLLVFVAALAASLVGLLPAWANKLAFGTVVPSGQVGLVAPIAMLLVGVCISSALIGICRNLVMSRVTAKLRIATEAATFSRVLLLPTSFFKEYESGDLASRVSQVTTLVQLLTSLMLGTLLTALLSVVYMGQIWAFASMLTIPALIVVVLQAGLTSMVTRISMRRQRLVMKSQAGLSGLVTALLSGVQKIKLAGAEDRAFAKWAHAYAEFARVSYNQPVIERALPAIVSFIGMLGTAAIYYFAGSAKLSVADYMAFNTAYGQVTGSIMALAAAAGEVAQIQPMLELVHPILKAVPEMADDKPSIEGLSGAIEVSNLTFRYNEKSPYILQDLSFRVHPGEYVAIVGKSGCGKSTIMRLLLGFEKPDRGSVFYGPHDISKIDLRSLRQSIGMVMQDGKIFTGDICSNITISTPGATLDDAWEAAEIAGIADDIRAMPMGMQTILSEGSGGVSGGQRQRILIARAVCGHRSILMLDEATSALDNVTQRHVADSLETLKCTRLVVAHRLSTVRHCDRIMLVDGGRIAEEGTYEELIERDGLFAELVRRQRLE